MQDKNLEEKIQLLENELSSMKAKEESKKNKLTSLLKYSVITALLSGSLYGFAAVITSLHIFNDGEVISAQKINENFQYLENKINGVSGGGSLVQNIATHQTIAITPADSGTLYVVQNTAVLNLPDITTVDPGFSFKVSLVNFAEVRMNLFSGDDLDGSTDIQFFMAEDSGYREFISTGSNWITSISSGGFVVYVNPANLVASSCSGKGFGADNCFTNGAATAAGFIVRNDNHLYNYYTSGTEQSWTRKIDNKYLINDPNNVITGVDLTDKYYLGVVEVKQIGGISFVVFPYTNSISSIADWNDSVRYHGGENNDDWLNQKIDAFLVYDVGPPKKYYGSNCQNYYGENWTVVTPTQATTIGDVGVDYWTSRAGAGIDEFEYMSGGTAFTTTDVTTTPKYQVCVLN